MSSTPSPQLPPIDPETRRLILDVVRDQVRTQDNQFDSLRTKGQIIVAASSIVLGLTINQSVQWHHPIIAILLWVAGIAMAVAVVSGVRATSPTDVYRNPRPQGLQERYLREPLDKVEEELIRQYVDGYHKSAPMIGQISERLKFSGWSLTIGVLALVAAALLRWGIEVLPDRRVGQITGLSSASPQSEVRVDSAAVHTPGGSK
jgi:hypothetical protein